MIAPFVAGGYPWPARGTVCDVAGGVGTLLARCSARGPSCAACSSRRPACSRGAAVPRRRRRRRPRRAARGRHLRARRRARRPVPAQGRPARLGRRAVRQILRTVAAAMPPGARVVLVETLQEPDRPDPMASLIDVHMLTQCDGGRQRSVAELQALLRGAGLEPGARAPHRRARAGRGRRAAAPSGGGTPTARARGARGTPWRTARAGGSRRGWPPRGRCSRCAGAVRRRAPCAPA